MKGVTRRLPVGAEYVEGGVHFRVWSPKRKKVEVVIDGSSTELSRTGEYFEGVVKSAKPGTRYQFRLNGESTLYPDPMSRFLPDGPHGPSEIVDPSQFKWTDRDWKGLTPIGLVIYELHIGTFTTEGTWAAATRELESLQKLGVNCIELMPVSEFAGKFGWGYDGVNLFAPYHHYGSPDEFRAFIDRAHALGIGVILDVVYNHFGPDGNYMAAFAEEYFNPKVKNDWGAAINFDGPGNAGVREHYLTNTRYWIEEYHLDGFRFDATQAIVDSSKKNILAEICEVAKSAAKGRGIFTVNENEPQHTKLVRPEKEGGYGLDALWNDDLHHSMIVALSGQDEAYYTDHPGTPQEFISAAKYGYLFQGQRYAWQGIRRGTPALDLPAWRFVNYLQNHDQIANSGTGCRAHQISGPGTYKAITAMFLLFPQTPMLFQGQEFAATSPFYYFADHKKDLAKLIYEGRARELSQFPRVATPEVTANLPDPADVDTFNRSKLNRAERKEKSHAQIEQLHHDVLKLRRSEKVFARVPKRGEIDGAILGPAAFVLRYFGDVTDEDRLLIVNLGKSINFTPAPEPLLAPPIDRRWKIVLSTEDLSYGGAGTAPLDTEKEGWLIPAKCTVVLKPVSVEEGLVKTRVRRAGAIENSSLD